MWVWVFIVREKRRHDLLRDVESFCVVWLFYAFKSAASHCNEYGYTIVGVTFDVPIMSFTAASLALDVVATLFLFLAFRGCSEIMSCDIADSRDAPCCIWSLQQRILMLRC